MTSQLSHDLPSVTVIVTTKDNSSTIRECVQSILRLNYPNERLKCLVIDASNNDSTASVIRDLPVKIVRYRGNAPASYNFALRSADTELVAFVDGDAKPSPNGSSNWSSR